MESNHQPVLANRLVKVNRLTPLYQSELPDRWRMPSRQTAESTILVGMEEGIRFNASPVETGGTSSLEGRITVSRRKSWV